MQHAPAEPRQESRCRRRLLRRLLGERGSLYVEFALVAPLLLAMGAFILDAAHLTLVRQQLEVGARFAADLESRAATAYGVREVKSGAVALNALRAYLAYATKPALGAAATHDEIHVAFRQKPLPFQFLGAFLDGKGESLVDKRKGNAVAMGLFSGALKSVLDLVSFRNVRYLTEPFAADYALGASVSMETRTLFPATLYGAADPEWQKGDFVALPEDPAAKEVARRWCYMPNREAFVDRRPTYTKATGDLIDKIKKKFKLK